MVNPRCTVSWMHLIVLLVCVPSNDALLPREGIYRRSITSCGITRHTKSHRTRSSIRTPIVSHGRIESALFWGWRKEKSSRYNVYGQKNGKKLPEKDKPMIVEKHNIYEKRPSGSGYTAQEANGRALLRLIEKRKKERLESNALYTKGGDETSFEMIDVNKDGVIDKEEFEKATKMKRSSPPSDMASIGKEIEGIEESIEQLAPLERQSFRLAGFDPYILVSVLTAGESFDVIAGYKPKWDCMAEKVSLAQLTDQDLYMQLLLVIAAASTLLGAYAAVTFALTVLYGKTAIGLDRDEAYYEFLDNTGLQRLRGFIAFTVSLGLFCVIVFMEMLEKTPAIFRLPVAVLIGAFLYFGRNEYRFITDMAAPIFQQVAKKEPEEEK